MKTLPMLCVEMKLRAENGVPLANSRDIADLFDKRHDNVLADIDRLRGSPEISGDWFREVKTINEQNRQEYRSFDVTRQGFTLLVMGWGGERALQFKVRYIEAFDAMEMALNQGAPVTGTELIQAVREIVAPLAIRFDTTDQAIERIEDRQNTQAEDIAAIKQTLKLGRKKPTKETIEDHIDAVQQLGGTCPVYPEIKIVENGKRLPFSDIDHFWASHLPTADHTWLISRKAHNDITYGRLSREMATTLFNAYQMKRRRLPGRQSRMF